MRHKRWAACLGDVVEIPQAGQIFLHGDGLAGVEIDHELRAVHARKTVTRGPAGGFWGRDLLQGMLDKGSEQPGPETAIIVLGPFPPQLGILILCRLLSGKILGLRITAKTVAHEDQLFASRATARKGRAQHQQGVTVQVIDMGVHGVFEANFPVHRPVGHAVQNKGVRIKKLLGHVFFNRRHVCVANPDKDHAFEFACWIHLRLSAGLATHT